MTDQAIERAHLRSLPRCADCGKPATLELRNGVNATLGVYCDRCGKRRLGRIRREGSA